MARPPYSPVPDATPTTQSTPYIGVNTSPAAFGGTIGQAEQQLGGQEEQAGAKLFAVAEQQQNDIITRDVSDAVFNKLNPSIDQKYSNYMTLEGKAAHDGYAPFIKDINDTIQQGAGQFTSPVAQQMYLSNARYLRQRIELSASTYAAQQLKQSFITTNTAANENLTSQSVFMQNDADLIVKNGEQIRANAEMNALHLNKTGDDATAMINHDVGQYYQQVISAKLLAPPGQGGGAASALALYNSVRGKLDANSSDAIARMLHPAVKDAQAEAQLGTILQGLGAAPGGGGGGAAPQWKGGTVSADQMNSALWGQESGGKANAPTSITGATGGHQIQPATFQQYARPGEDIKNEADNAVVGARIVTDLTQRYQGDPARVAVAYFSGPGNVAPAGSATPWLEDKKDPTGKSTSSYVNDVLGRLGGAQGAGGQQGGGTQISAPGGEGQAAPSGWRMPDWSKAEQDALAATEGDPEGRTALLGKLAQTRQRIEMATATERTNLEKQFGDLSKAAEAGVQISIPEDRIRAVFPPDVADRYITTLGVSQAAGQVMSSLKYASPEQLSTTVADLTSGTGTVSDNLRARLGKVTGGTVTTPEGPNQASGVTESSELFGLRTQIAAKAIQIIQARQEQLRQDPASYTLGEPSVAGAAKAMDPKNPASFDQYATTQLSIQDHLGVRPEAQHVLTKQQADTFTQQVMQPGTDAKATLDGLEKQWGDAWPHVFGDMVTLGKMPAEYQGVVALDDPKDAALLSRALAEKQKSGKDWDDLLGHPTGAPPVAQGIRNDIRTNPEMQQLEHSWAGSGATIEQISSMRGAVEQLAYAKRFYENSGTAAQDAVTSFTSKYRFIPNGGARVPADKYDAVMGSAGQMLSTASPTTIAIPPEFRTEDTAEARRLRPAAPPASDYIANLQANPTWITSPKGDGMMLLDNGARLVRSPDGKPLFVPFNAPPSPNAPPAQFNAGPPTGAP